MSAASIEGPQLGLVFDATHKALRPILGIPGAAILGQPLNLGVELNKIAISPRQDYALATEGQHNQVVMLTVGRKTVTPVPGALQDPDEILPESRRGRRGPLLQEQKRSADPHRAAGNTQSR